MQCELDAEARDSLTALAYRTWGEAFDDLKAVKGETDDNLPDWELMHAERLKNNTARLDKAKRVLDQIKKYSPLICGE